MLPLPFFTPNPGEKISYFGDKANPLLSGEPPTLENYSKPIGQGAFTDKYKDTLDQKGVCNGLCMDYTRHNLKDRQASNEGATETGKEEKANFIDKLNKKINSPNPEDAQNFANRIESYQTSLQTGDVSKTFEQMDLSGGGIY